MMQQYRSCKCFATGSLLAPVTPMAWKNSTAGPSLLPSALISILVRDPLTSSIRSSDIPPRRGIRDAPGDMDPCRRMGLEYHT